MFKWEIGRRNCSYSKLTLIKLKKFDCHLIKIKRYGKIPMHTDVVEGYKHYRLNIKLKGQYSQCFLYLPAILNKFITFFRPDINNHMVGTCNSEVLIFSIGWIIKDK